MTSSEKRIVGFTAVAHGLNHAVELVFGAVLLVVAFEFDARIALLGAIANGASLSYSLMALPAGQLADHWGSKRMVALSMGGSGIAAAMAAAAPNLAMLAIALIIMGMLGGLYHPAGLSFITRGVRHRARALGIHGAGGNLGTAIAPGIAGGVAGIWKWRASFVVFAILALSIAAASLRSKAGETDDELSDELKKKKTTTLLVPLGLMFVINAGFGFNFRGLTTFLPLHLGTNLGFNIANLDPVAVGGGFATVALCLA